MRFTPFGRSTRGVHQMWRKGALATPIALACVAGVAHAQFRASIQGTVTDPQGAVVPGATITLADVDTGRSQTAVSNDSGVYNFGSLAPDRYKLTATAPGFKQQVIDNYRLNPEQANAVNFQLALGSSETTVNVSGDQVAALNTETANVSGSVDSNQIQHLPTAGRDVFQLVQLSPGVFADGSQTTSGSNNLPGSQGPGGSGHSSGIFSTENGPQANANGGQYETNGISIDGISTVSAVWGGTSIITPTEDSVGDVTVVANQYDAENGRFSGAQVQITSKAGTNQYHGSLFFRANRPGLNAYQRYNGASTFTAGSPDARGLQRDTTRSNQYGGSVGGPILHNRLFAFFAYETQRNNAVATSTGWFETPTFDALTQGGPIATQYLTFAGGGVSASSLIDVDCTAAGLVEGTNCHHVAGQGLNIGSPLTSAHGTQDLTWRSSTNPGVGSGLTNVADIAEYNLTNPTTTVGDQYNGRLDGDVGSKDHLEFAIYWVPYSNTSFVGSNRGYNLYHHTQTNDAYTAIWIHTFSPKIQNEARANDAGWRWNEVSSNPQEPFGLPTAQVDQIGDITLASFGAPGPSVFNQHTYSYKDVATAVEGNHTLKFGGEVTRLYYLNDPTYSARPSYNFYNLWAFLNDAPHSESGSFDPTTGIPTTNRQDTRQDLYGFFAQDQWKARTNLTIGYGLRYNYFGPYSSKQNNLGVVQLGTGAAAYTGLNIRQGGNLTRAQKANLGPQFSFNFVPAKFNSKMAIRGGYGLNYNQTEIAITGNSGGNPPYVLNASFNNSSIKNGVASIDPHIVYATAGTPYTLFGYPANPNATGGFNSVGLPVGGGANVTAYQDLQPTIYTHHFSLDTQYDLGYNLVATVGYQGSLSRHLIVQSQLYAATYDEGLAFNPLVTNIDYYANTGNSSNNSLLLGLKHNMSHHVQFDAEFNLAKTMDTGSGPYYEDPYPFRPDLAYGRSDFNYGKAFKLYGLWQPIFFHNNSLLSKILDGFSFSGIYNFHTGFPYTPTYNAGNNFYYAASGYNSLRPAAYLGGNGHNTSNSAFESGRPNVNFSQAGTNQPYFAIPATGITATGNYDLPQLPGVSRNYLTGPGYQDVDATVTKAFGLPNARILGEHANLEIRADAFNLFNQINLNPAAMVTNIQLATFGQVVTNGSTNAALAARVVNLQARFSF